MVLLVFYHVTLTHWFSALCGLSSNPTPYTGLSWFGVASKVVLNNNIVRHYKFLSIYIHKPLKDF